MRCGWGEGEEVSDHVGDCSGNCMGLLANALACSMVCGASTDGWPPVTKGCWEAASSRGEPSVPLERRGGRACWGEGIKWKDLGFWRAPW